MILYPSEEIEMDSEASGIEQNEGSSHKLGLLFEIEHMAVDGRRIAYDVAKSMLADKEVKLTKPFFSRYCLHPSPEQYIPMVLEACGKKSVSGDKLAEEIREGILVLLDDGRISIRPALSRILAEWNGPNLFTGVLSALGEASANRLAARLGIQGERVKMLTPVVGDRAFPSADNWLRLSKMIGVPASSCTVLGTSATARRAALSAGMRCIAFPDEFTSFQDFGGADYIVNEVNDRTMAEILPVLKPTW
jgi:beta-phosphoglucomutase-like phosphatase (HAD superfamily)